MKCDEVRGELDAYADNELPAGRKREIDAHLHTCVECSAHYQALSRFSAVIKSAGIRDSAPAHLAQRVSEHLDENENRMVNRCWWTTGLAYSLPALLLGVLIGWAGVTQFAGRDSTAERPRLLASAHIRSLMADHLTDIASSDSHTVKPWFHGRLDFSPPVEDLTRQGYPLLGGRLDYIAGKAAAALVYRHRQHIINVFIAPGSATAAGTRTENYRGYTIVRWNDGALSYAAVSDLNVSDLERFRQLLSGRAPAPR